jgi:O-methyltransferase domain/Dimerisation domain
MNIPKTDPTQIIRLRDGLYAVDLLGAAITGLDFFSRLAEQPADLKAICKMFGIQERPTDVMLTLFTAMELLRQRNGMFEVTETAREFLVKDSYWYLGPYYGSMQERPVCKDFLTVLRTGKPANWASYKDEKEWTKAMENERFARTFTAAMDCRGRYLGHALAKVVNLRGTKRLLDIAGGSGIYARTLAEANPHLRATILEKPPVDKIAREGATDRVDVVVSDMFKDPIPEGYDSHLFSNVLHDWDLPVVETLVGKSFAALPAGGLIIIHDAHLNAEKSGPLAVAEYSALLMNISEGRCYSVTETEAFLNRAGFREFTFQPTAVNRSVVTARKS